jgi:hypothetical protein
MVLCCHHARGSVQAMTSLREVFGALAGSAALGSLTLGTPAVRRRFLSTLHGPPARLADVVGVSSITIVVSQLLRVVGLYRFYAVAPVLAQIPTAREPTWTANDQAGRLILTEHEGKAAAWVYALPGHLDPTACPRTPSS